MGNGSDDADVNGSDLEPEKEKDVLPLPQELDSESPPDVDEEKSVL